MTTSSESTPWGLKYQTVGYLIYRIKDKQLEAYALFETREAAEEDLALINRRSSSWRIANVPFLGWGIVDGVVGRNQQANIR
jgi:hypothetical protein